MISIYTYFFPPKLSPGSFRSFELVKSLIYSYSGKKLPVTVFTARPLSERKESKFKLRLNKSVNVVTIWVPFSNESILKNILNAFVYFFSCWMISKNYKPKIIFGTSGRFATNFTASVIAIKSSTPFILDVRDLFHLNLREIILRKYFIIKDLIFWFFLKLEKYFFSKALFINIVSEGFLQFYKKQGFNTQNWTFFPNGIDDLFLREFENYQPLGQKKKIKYILYAGNLGEGQGVEKMIVSLSKNLPKNWVFKIFGKGKYYRSIKKLIQKFSLNNIQISKQIERHKLMYWYKNSDILLISLNNYNCLEHVIPSKFFELAVVGKPIIAGVNGYAKNFMKKNISNIYFFPPLNVRILTNKINQVTNTKYSDQLNDLKKTNFINNYKRDFILNKFSIRILEYLN